MSREHRSALERLLDHLEWANRCTLEALETAADGEEALRLLAHLLGAERVWLERIAGTYTPELELFPELTLPECRRLAAESTSRLRQLVHGASEEELAAPVHYRNSRGEAFATPLVDILLHVVLHGTHHRGQIARVLRQGGEEPGSTDYITFVRREA